MTDEEWLSAFRQAIHDTIEPFVYSDGELRAYLLAGVAEYSKYRPLEKFDQIELVPYVEKYTLPKDYQTWILGLEGYQVLEKTLIKKKNRSCAIIEFSYYADRGLLEIPNRDMGLLIDFGIAEVIEGAVQKKSAQGEESITALQLGKGLDITFDNTKAMEKKLYEIAREKKEGFRRELRSRLAGSWC